MIAMRRLKIAGLVPVLLLALPALAQADPVPPPAAPKDIIVTGRTKIDSHALEQQAKAITRGGDLFHEPLARFQNPVCPGIMGMKPDLAALMVDRIRYDAERADIEVASENGCRPNILIFFVRNSRTEFRNVLKKRGYLLTSISMEEIHELEADTGPVHAWVNTAVFSRHGEPVASGVNDDGTPPVMTAPMGDSHIFLATRLDIESSIVVIDVAAIDGMSIDQIADYAAMRSLARTRPTGDGAALGTILSLFDAGGDRPTEMTTFDIAYLKSIYGKQANLPGVVNIGGMTRAMRKETGVQSER
jgi:hypothetical protein